MKSISIISVKLLIKNVFTLIPISVGIILFFSFPITTSLVFSFNLNLEFNVNIIEFLVTPSIFPISTYFLSTIFVIIEAYVEGLPIPNFSRCFINEASLNLEGGLVYSSVAVKLNISKLVFLSILSNLFVCILSSSESSEELLYIIINPSKIII